MKIKFLLVLWNFLTSMPCSKISSKLAWHLSGVIVSGAYAAPAGLFMFVY